MTLAENRFASRRRWWLAAGLAGLALLATVLFLNAADRPPAAPSVTSTPPLVAEPGAVAPEAFGAVGDGRSDDGPALQAALDSLVPGQVLQLAEARTYRHDDLLLVRREGTGLRGPGTLLAGQEERSSLQVKASDVVISGLVLEIVETTRRWQGNDQHRLVVGEAQRVLIEDVEVRGSAGAGIYVEGAQDFILRDVRVTGTRADGIHMTGGSQDGLVQRPVVEASGDDAVAVVSYEKDRAVSRRIRIEDVQVLGTTGGRGITVVGGEDIEYRGAQVRDSAAASVYVATEGDPYYTRSVERVTIDDVEVVRANRDATIDHGAVLVYAGNAGTHVRDVSLTDIRVSDTRQDAARQAGVLVRPDAEVSDIELLSFDVVGGGSLLTVPDDVVIRDWTVGGRKEDDPRD